MLDSGQDVGLPRSLRRLFLLPRFQLDFDLCVVVVVLRLISYFILAATPN